MRWIYENALQKNDQNMKFQKYKIGNFIENVALDNFEISVFVAVIVDGDDKLHEIDVEAVGGGNWDSRL